MPILYTGTYSSSLHTLRQNSPDVAELIEQIAEAIKHERQPQKPESLVSVLLAHADALVMQLPSCVARLDKWVKILAAYEGKALEDHEVSAFVEAATRLGGPSGLLAG